MTTLSIYPRIQKPKVADHISPFIIVIVIMDVVVVVVLSNGEMDRDRTYGNGIKVIVFTAVKYK